MDRQNVAMEKAIQEVEDRGHKVSKIELETIINVEQDQVFKFNVIMTNNLNREIRTNLYIKMK